MSPPFVAAIVSFSRGCGRTVLTANLAVLLAARGMRVAAVDIDLPAPSLSQHFGPDESPRKPTLNDFLRGRCAIAQVAREIAGGFGPAGQGRVFLVPASERAQDVSEVLRSGHDTQVLHDGLQALGESLRLDALLADAPAGLTETSLSVMAISQAVLVLLRPDQRDYQGTGVLIDVARKLNVPDVELVVSQVPGGYDPAQVRATVERAYGCRVAALLPLVSDVPLSAPGAVFAVARQQHRWSQSVAQLAERLAPPPGERSPASRGHAETQESR